MIYELLFCIILISIFSIFTLKNTSKEVLAISKASAHIQTLQKELHDLSYNSYLSKKALDNNEIQKILRKYVTNNIFFKFSLQNNYFILEINKNKLKMEIIRIGLNSLSVTCNPTQYLCRKIYNRKLNK